jgi:hypothetical protein
MTYGVAVHGETDSGWRVTGFSKGLPPHIVPELESLTSVGEISETWAADFENGLAYFGRFEEDDRAIFALFYRSRVESARGRYFVPRIVLSIPYQDYIDKLKCDPFTLFELLIRYKEEKAPVICEKEPVVLQDFYDILPIPARSLDQQLLPLSEALDRHLFDHEYVSGFLTSVLRPEPHMTLVWRGNNPDPNLTLAMISLLPAHLRRFITFCTSVENPRVGNLRVKIIKNPVDPGDNSFVMMKENSFKVNQSPLPFETSLPAILVDLLDEHTTTGTAALADMHRFIDSTFETDGWQQSDFNETLEKTETLAQLYLMKKQVIESMQTDVKLYGLLQYHSQLQILEEENILKTQQTLDEVRRFTVDQFELAVMEIETGVQLKMAADALRLLAQALPQLHEDDRRRFSGTLLDKGNQLPLGSLLWLAKIFNTIPSLNDIIALELAEKLTLHHISGWEESFQLISWLAQEDRLQTLKNRNKNLFSLLKELPVIDFVFDLLLLLSPSRKLNVYSMNGLRLKLQNVDDEYVDKLYTILRTGFLLSGDQDKTGAHTAAFLWIAAHSYTRMFSIGVDTLQDFRETFTQHFRRVIRFNLDSSWNKKTMEIPGIVNTGDPDFAARLEVIINQENFRRLLLGCGKKLKEDSGTAPFIERQDVQQFFILMDENRSSIDYPSLSTAAIHMILDANTLSTATVYGGYLDYLKRKRTLNKSDIRNMKAILISDPTPLRHPRYLLDSLILGFNGCSGQPLVLLVVFLLDVAKEFAADSQRYTGSIDFSLRETVKERWRPSSVQEVREIYSAVYHCLGKSIAGWFLWHGAEQLPEVEKMKLLADAVNELFDEFSMLNRKESQYYNDLLNYIGSDSPSTHPVLIGIGEVLIDIRSKKDDYEKYLDRIKNLLKQIKKYY